jgi:site-specific DNA-cytosine methylase
LGVADFVRDLKPQFFLMENVPALASDVHNRQLAIAVFEELESLGYELSAEVVNAATAAKIADLLASSGRRPGVLRL